MLIKPRPRACPVPDLKQYREILIRPSESCALTYIYTWTTCSASKSVVAIWWKYESDCSWSRPLTSARASSAVLLSYSSTSICHTDLQSKSIIPSSPAIYIYIYIIYVSGHVCTASSISFQFRIFIIIH